MGIKRENFQLIVINLIICSCNWLLTQVCVISYLHVLIFIFRSTSCLHTTISTNNSNQSHHVSTTTTNNHLTSTNSKYTFKWSRVFKRYSINQSPTSVTNSPSKQHKHRSESSQQDSSS